MIERTSMTPRPIRLRANPTPWVMLLASSSRIRLGASISYAATTLACRSINVPLPDERPKLLDPLAQLDGRQLSILLRNHFARSRLAGGNQSLVFDRHLIPRRGKLFRDAGD